MKFPIAVSKFLQSKLKKSDLEIQMFVDALRSEVSKIQKRLLDVEAKNEVLDVRIHRTEEENRKLKKKMGEFYELQNLSIEEQFKRFKSLIDHISST